jgi:hypothetical protein
MNSLAIKAAGRYFGCWGAMVFFVVLLTTIFSFLGTIICAVLAGMMMGAAKHKRWQALPVAIVFPAVIFTMLRSTRAEILGRQVMVLSLLCFSAFWLSYVVTAALMAYEAKARASAGEPTAARSSRPSQASPDAGVEAGCLQGAAAAARQLCLEDLQGQWGCQAAGRNGEGRSRSIEISGSKVILRTGGPDGQARTLALGELRLESDGPARVPSNPGQRTD